MYLHLGQNTVVPTASVVAIFDLDNTSASRDTRDFLKAATDKRQVINVSDELPKSFVVCSDESGTKVYISQLAAATLQKRADDFKYL